MGESIAERRLAVRDCYAIFAIPEETEAEPGDLLYGSPEKEKEMQKMTKDQEYTYYLGHATAIAGVCVLIESLPKEHLREFMEEWVTVLKKGYAKTALWGDALSNLNQQHKKYKENEDEL